MTKLPSHPEPHSYTWTPLEKEAIYDALIAAHKEGKEEGIRMYAWWKDGEQFVGTCGTTLESALKEIK